MDIRQLAQLFNLAASGSLILMGSTAVFAGDRAHEQPTRPHMSAACAPNWGFNQTCWNRFPPLPGCPRSDCDSMSQGYENYPSQQLLYTPQDSLLLPDSRIVSPEYHSAPGPISVFPNMAQDPSLSEIPAMPYGKDLAPSVVHPRRFGPAQIPAIPDARSLPEPFVPRPSSNQSPLPPLPAPPEPAPTQSSLQPNMIMGPNRQMIPRPYSASISSPQTGARYGHVGHSALTRPVAEQGSPGSFTHALVANTQRPPVQILAPMQETNHRPALATAFTPTGRRYEKTAITQQATGNQQMPLIARYARPPVTAVPTQPAVNVSEPGQSRVPAVLASQSRMMQGGTTNSSYRSGNAMPPVPEPVGQMYQPGSLTPVTEYPMVPFEPLRRTP